MNDLVIMSNLNRLLENLKYCKCLLGQRIAGQRKGLPIMGSPLSDYKSVFSELDDLAPILLTLADVRLVAALGSLLSLCVKLFSLVRTNLLK